MPFRGFQSDRDRLAFAAIYGQALSFLRAEASPIVCGEALAVVAALRGYGRCHCGMPLHERHHTHLVGHDFMPSAVRA
jgi:hypothetical protein